MRIVVDANIIISGLIRDSATRRLLIEIEPDLLTPAYVHDEIDTHIETVMEKSGLEEPEVEQLIQIQAGNPVVHDGEERDMVRTNRRTMAD